MYYTSRVPDESFNKQPNRDKKGQKKAIPTTQKPEMKPNFICGLPFFCQKKHLKFLAANKFSAKLRLGSAWPFIAAYSSEFSDFSCFVRLHNLGTMVPQFAY